MEFNIIIEGEEGIGTRIRGLTAEEARRVGTNNNWETIPF